MTASPDLRAVRGGQRLRALEDALAGIAPAPATPELGVSEPGVSKLGVPEPDAPEAPPAAPLAELTHSGPIQSGPGENAPPDPPRRRTPWRLVRFVGRRGLRLFRPFVLPLLHRFEWRVRTAVDKSDFAVATPHALRDGFAAARLRLDQGLEALRQEMERHAAAADAAVAATQATLARQRADALRLFEHTGARLGALAEQQAHLIHQLDHSHLVMAALRREAAEREAAAERHRQDSQRLLRGSVVPLGQDDYLVRTPYGWLVAPGEDERLLMAMAETGGLLERGTTAVLLALLRPGDTMVDVGAHIGTMTLPAARAVGPAGRVIAVEPGPRAAALLRRGLHINSLAEQVSLHVCAAGAVAGAALLHTGPVLGENTLLGATAPPADGGPATDGTVTDATGTVAVALRPLDDLVPPAAQGGRVAVVKIDAEGYELEVWRGMRRILSDNPDLAVIVEFGPSHLVRAGIAPAAWLDALRAPGFTPWEIDEATGALRPLRAEAELAATFSMNLLLLRRPPSAWPELRVA